MTEVRVGGDGVCGWDAPRRHRTARSGMTGNWEESKMDAVRKGGRTFAWYVTVKGETACTQSTVARQETASRRSENASTHNEQSSPRSHGFVSNAMCPG